MCNSGRVDNRSRGSLLAVATSFFAKYSSVSVHPVAVVAAVPPSLFRSPTLSETVDFAGQFRGVSIDGGQSMLINKKQRTSEMTLLARILWQFGKVHLLLGDEREDTLQSLLSVGGRFTASGRRAREALRAFELYEPIKVSGEVGADGR